VSDARPSESHGEATVEPKLQAFIETIKRSSTYRDFIEADEALADDPEAMALLQEYRETRMRLQRNGFDESAMAELRDLRREMADVETIQRHQAARDALEELLTRTNEVISEEIGREFAQSTGGGCC